jgi:predicted adenine nucleotide alpha hydrolase (AANH) superfamily ATPase
MKILLHICCAPCSIYPVRVLRRDDHDIMGYFYNSNIHPYTEYLKRQDALSQYARQIDLKIVIAETYDMEDFLRAVTFRESERCRYCYFHRLRATARVAKESMFDAFSSTLLYSKFQKHAVIQSIGETVAQEVGIPFFYEDFRTGWQEGVQTSKALGIYRQQYCGCIYSEKERYCRRSSRERDLQT